MVTVTGLLSKGHSFSTCEKFSEKLIFLNIFKVLVVMREPKKSQITEEILK